MALADLGNRIAGSLAKISQQPKIDEKSFQLLLNDISRALMDSDVNISLIQKLNKNIKSKVGFQDLPKGIDIKRVIEKAIVSELTSLLDCGKQPWRPQRKKTNIIMFVGLQGNGKTTTVTKLAHYYKKRGWKVGVVCADSFRAGAFVQLAQNCARIKVPFFGDPEEKDPAILAEKGVATLKKQKKAEIVIVDTSGRHKQEESLFAEMEGINDAIHPHHTILVLDATIGQQAQPQAEAFCQHVSVGSVIVTKLDGQAKGGGALSAVAAAQAPITFIGTGEHVNNLEKFDAGRFVNRILGKGDIAGFVEAVKEQKLDDQKELIANIKKGKFTLRMMKEQFDNILKLGSFGSIMQMIPGLNQLPKQSEEASQKRLQSFMYIMDSMTDEELDSDISLIEGSVSRQKRIAMGSGVHLGYIRELIQVYKPFAQAIPKMKNLPWGKNGEMPKNPQDMGKLASMLPGNVLKQIGGQQGFMNLMQKFQGADGGAGAMQSMQNMQSMMKGMQKRARVQRRRK